jgi:hypothetical protein
MTQVLPEQEHPEQQHVIERLGIMPYAGAFLRVDEQIYLIDQTDPELIRSAFASHAVPVTKMSEMLQKGTIDILVVIAIHKEQINQSLRTHFEMQDKPVDPSQLVDMHALVLNVHPQFEQDETDETHAKTLTLISPLFPNFSVNLGKVREEQATVELQTMA